jgi:hypothetical protein
MPRAGTYLILGGGWTHLSVADPDGSAPEGRNPYSPGQRPGVNGRVIRDTP